MKFLNSGEDRIEENREEETHDWLLKIKLKIGLLFSQQISSTCGRISFRKLPNTTYYQFNLSQWADLTEIQYQFVADGFDLWVFALFCLSFLPEKKRRKWERGRKKDKRTGKAKQIGTKRSGLKHRTMERTAQFIKQ